MWQSAAPSSPGAFVPGTVCGVEVGKDPMQGSLAQRTG